MLNSKSHAMEDIFAMLIGNSLKSCGLLGNGAEPYCQIVCGILPRCGIVPQRGDIVTTCDYKKAAG